MNKKDITGFELVVILVLFPILCFCLGIYQGREDLEYDAVEAGHAEFYLDEDNSKQWRWKKEAKNE